MKGVLYEEEGVASAVGAILAILIFIFLLSIYVTSYVPAEMTSYEEQYSSSLMDEIMQFASSVNSMSVNYQQGETVSVTFDLQSGYIPLFSSPTLGELTLSGATNRSNGFIEVNNTKMSVTSGGALTVLTNNRYFVDEAVVYEFSSLYYEQYGSSPLINSTLAFNLMQVNPPTNGTINLSMDLVDMQGGTLSTSSGSPFDLTATALSKNIYKMDGNFTLTLSSSFGTQIFKSLQDRFSYLKGVALSLVNEGNGSDEIFIRSPSTISLTVSVLTVMIGLNGS